MEIETYKEDYSQRLIPFNQIKRKDKTDYTYIKSGYKNIDQLIGGFILGQISVWSGLNGSGKSAFLNQQIVEYINQNYKVMLFSGEFQSFQIKNIMYRLIAGKKYLQKSEDGTYYYLANDKLKQAIDDYVSDKMYVYNNKYGAKPQEIIETIRYAKEHYNISVVILDNLMTMNLKDLNRDKFEAQSEFAIMIANLAKELNVHIHIVMHPRKTTGFLRKNDISGSADLSNATDNLFIVHRNNNDFKKAYMEFNQKISKDDELFSYDNYVEICKNREEGIQDRLLCFRFIRESKQLVETSEEKDYMAYVKNDYYAKRSGQ